jgi:hypothetical protein
MNRSILDAFTIFPFAIVLSLALGEAFKTVISEERFIECKKLYALGSFLFLILPFYQGMNRYLLATYGLQAPTGGPPGAFLIGDGAAFMLESALFFVMSRTLSIERWQQFYWVVFALLIVDSAWGLSAMQHAPDKTVEVIKSWIALNVVTDIVILLLVAFCSRFKNVQVTSAIATLMMLGRTIIDYRISWDFYFQ